MVTDNTSFLPPPLHSYFFANQIFFTDVRVSLLDCVFELQYLFNQTLLSKWICVLIKETTLLPPVVAGGGIQKYDYAMSWIIWTEEAHGCFWMQFFSFSAVLSVFSAGFVFCFASVLHSPIALFPSPIALFPSRPESHNGPSSCIRL